MLDDSLKIECHYELRCLCGNVLDRGPRTTRCSSCITLKSRLRAQAPRVCVECGEPYTGVKRRYCTSFCRNTSNERDKQRRAGSVVITSKLCSACKVERPAFMFNFASDSIDHLSSHCRPCKATRHKTWRERAENRDAIRRGNLRRAYGISLEEYEQLLAYQGGACALCKRPASDFKKRLAVEHDHKTGAIRSLACFRCNKLMIGKLTLDDARRLIAYFEAPPADAFFNGKRLVPEKLKRRKRHR